MSQAAEEYAAALYDSLKTSTEKAETLSFLRAVSTSLDNVPAFYEGLKSQSLNDNEIRSIFKSLTDATGCSDLIKNFFNLLVDNKRVAILSEVGDSFQKQLDKENNIVRGVVKSAHTVSTEKRTELEDKLTKKLDQKVILTFEEDKSVLAGVRVELDSYTLDDTMETHLKKIKENVNRSAN